MWKYAKENGFCIVSKDTDFGDWAQLHGYPPAVVLVKMGNCNTRTIITRLRAEADKIRQLGIEGQPWVLVLY